jgi:hypothetical protein
MFDVLQRPIWSGVPIKGDDFFVVRKRKGDTEHVAVCQVWSHVFGWELRLLVNKELHQSQVCGIGQNMIDTAEAWKIALLEKGWLEGSPNSDAGSRPRPVQNRTASEDTLPSNVRGDA